MNCHKFKWRVFVGPLATLVLLSASPISSGCSGTGNCANNGAIQEYDSTKNYAKGSKVCFKGKCYINAYWANPDQCPLQSECPDTFVSGLWSIFDPDAPTVLHEFANYDKADGGYPGLQKEAYSGITTCTAGQYDQSSVKIHIGASASSGEISRAAPDGGYSANDIEALYREYMLSCVPSLGDDYSADGTPFNVKIAAKVMPLATWNILASKTATGDLGSTYTTADEKTAPWPVEPGFKDSAYANFLSAVARYPYFCGEAGYFPSVEEACKREIASLFAHAAFETGNTNLLQSFYWLREYGYVDANQRFADDCNAPLDCATNKFARYYGRGPKQLTSYYNYTGFSAAYLNGDYNFLLLWPDLVAYDGKMFFESAIFFVMTNQPPKPSIHDIMLGRYKPNPSCVSAKDCDGVQFDPVSGVKNNFDITIEAVNGGVQCRANSKADAKENARGRTRAFLDMLARLDAVLTDGELALVQGCDFITTSSATVFGNDKLKAGLSTWIDLSARTCKAQSLGGKSTISVTATGIVDACLSAKLHN